MVQVVVECVTHSLPRDTVHFGKWEVLINRWGWCVMEQQLDLACHINVIYGWTVFMECAL